MCKHSSHKHTFLLGLNFLLFFCPLFLSLSLSTYTYIHLSVFDGHVDFLVQSKKPYLFISILLIWDCDFFVSFCDVYIGVCIYIAVLQSTQVDKVKVRWRPYGRACRPGYGNLLSTEGAIGPSVKLDSEPVSFSITLWFNLIGFSAHDLYMYLCILFVWQLFYW